MPRAEYTGHGENTGGLQMHSIGDDYPFAVIGTQHVFPGGPRTADTRYYVQNLATGETYYWRNPFTDQANTWGTSSDAHAAIGWIKGGHTTCITKLED